MKIPVLNQSFVGSGDLFAALFLAWSHHHPTDVKLVFEKVLSTMQLVLRRTDEAAMGLKDCLSKL